MLDLLDSFATIGLAFAVWAMDTPVDSHDSDSTPDHPPQPLSIQGKLVALMDSWPLQLTLETSTGRYHVALLPETILSQSGQWVDVTALQPNLSLQVDGYTTQAKTLTAEAILILTP